MCVPLLLSGVIKRSFGTRILRRNGAERRKRGFGCSIEHPNPRFLRSAPFRRSILVPKLLLITPDSRRGTHMSMKLYVGNLSFQTSNEELQELFSQAGTVESANVIEDRETGRSRGFGFVEMASKEAGEAAIAQFNGKEVNGRNLNVNEAKPRENRSFGANRNGGHGGLGSGDNRKARGDFE